MRSYPFSNGDTLPAFGLGTWKSDPGEVTRAVEVAIRLGYRHIDCARIYGNEAEVGAALRKVMADGVARREDLFITSKLWNDAHAPKDVGPALDASLSELGLEYLDLYLMHWPIAFASGVSFPRRAEDLVSLDELPLEATWGAMEALVAEGRCRHIGVSNFSIPKLRTLLEKSERVKPEVNQVELHPYLQQRELVSFCKSNGILVTAYSPLGSKDRPALLKQPDEPILLEDPVVTGVAAARNATPAQVLIAWGLQRGTAVIPKSVSEKRIEENLAGAGLVLHPEDVEAIDALDKHRRYVDGSVFSLNGGPYTTRNIWDE